MSLMLGLAVFLAGLNPSIARAESRETKVLLLTSSYGVIAGSITGLASLAFIDSPGDHLRNVAMGASLGLYAGIALGAYMIWFVPDHKGRSSPKPQLKSDDPVGLGASNDSSTGTSNDEMLSFLPYFDFTPKAGARLGLALNF